MRGGQFRANWASPHFERRPPGEVLHALRSVRDGARRLQAIFEDIRGLLELRLQEAGYRGPLGVDAFLYRSADGALRLKPVVEINPRYTMGRLTLELMNQVHQGSRGQFRLLSRSQVRSAGHESFWTYSRQIMEANPLAFAGQPVPRIQAGTVCLNDPAKAEAYLALFEVTRPG